MRLPPVLPLALLVLAATGCGGVPEPGHLPPPAPRVDGLQLPARVAGTQIQVATPDGYRGRFWAGVNLGSTIPGHQPGEVAATRDDYDRWLWEMGRLGVTTVRVYTILRPAFYDALDAYDREHAAAPIRLIQGVWIPEERFLETGNAFDPQVTAGFRREIGDAVAVVHGDADLPVRPGHADGRYRSDVSPWLLAWSLGVEWDPTVVMSTDRLNHGMPAYQGRFITASADASPMESWIASMLDHAAALEAARGWSRPMTFTNWVTTDPLHHAHEPLRTEDAVSIDAMHLHATAAWPGGFFASYHVYPYYPDFLRHTPALQHGDPYANYLHELAAHHHGQALMITEFGVPSGLGIAHRGPLGRDQGDHSEAEAGQMDADMLRDIQREGLAGGMLFEWADEWFKFTWNTQDTAIPISRRSMWLNALTNEQHFGVIAMETTGQPSDGGAQIASAGDGEVRSLRVAHDPEYLYLRLQVDQPGAWRSQPVTIGLDTRPGDNAGLPGLPGVDPAADAALTIGPGDTAHIVQAAWTDPIAWKYGVARPLLQVRRADLEQGSGVWDSPRLALSLAAHDRVDGRFFPTQTVDVGDFRWGDWREPLYLARTHDPSTVDVRIPWALLTYSDPSSHQVYVPHPDGMFTTQRTGRVGIVVAAAGQTLASDGYDWAQWNSVTWHERPKAGWPAIAAAMHQTSAWDTVGAARYR